MTFKSLAARAHRLLDRKAVSIHDGTDELQEIEILAATRYRELSRAQHPRFCGHLGQWAHGDDDAALLCWQGILTAAMHKDGLSATKPDGENLLLRVGSMRPQAWRRRAEQTLAALRMLAGMEGKAPVATAGTKKGKKADRESEPKTKAGRPTISPEKRKLYARALNLNESTKRYPKEDKLAEFRREFPDDVKTEQDMVRLIQAAREQAKRDARK